jgi:hypothetical protein
MNKISTFKAHTNDSVLFLKGVYKSDISSYGDFYKNISHQKLYNVIPMTFESLEKWPRSTNVLCWHCHRSFKGRPWFEPQTINPVTKSLSVINPPIKLSRTKPLIDSIVINAKGNFCSVNCVASYINLYSHDLADKINKTNMMLYVAEIFTGIKWKSIMPAPSPYEMIQYGGTLTLDEYQKKIDASNKIISYETDEFLENCRNYSLE